MSVQVLYLGPSGLNGDPIVVLVSGMDGTSRNVKTGRVVQTWILHADVSPYDARNGADAAICGDCVHRAGSCYVNVPWGPTMVWRAWKRNSIEPLRPPTGMVVRVGAYGDPASIPLPVWTDWLEAAKGWIGYTHLWRTHPEFRSLCMASVDSPQEAKEARGMGWRTFRVRAAGSGLVGPAREIVCPASSEAGFKSTCEKCRLCDGMARAKAPHVVIDVHGPRKRAWMQTNLFGGPHA